MDHSDLEKRAYERIMLELTSRTAMMMTHGILLALIGFTMALTGAPAPIEASWGPWSRLALGAVAVASGAVIIFGAAETDNEHAGWLALSVGFTSGLLWHAGLSIAYMVAALQAKIVILSPGADLSSEITSRGYIPLVYLGYVILTGIHARTVWKLGPPPR